MVAMRGQLAVGRDATRSERYRGPGDLGRRLRARRLQLGLAVDEVAAISGVASSYLWHLELEPTAMVSASGLRCLARALATTPEVLLGAAGPSLDVSEEELATLRRARDLLEIAGRDRAAAVGDVLQRLDALLARAEGSGRGPAADRCS